MTEPETPIDVATASDHLDGWKAIAAYLRRDLRTVQRWELREGLPVHRHEHKKQATAYALRSEIDRWLAQRGGESQIDQSPEPVGRSARRRWVIGLGAALAGAGLLFVLTRTGPNSHVLSGRETTDSAAYSAFAEGEALYHARRYQEAVGALERAVGRDPKYAAAWATLAKTHARLAQPAWAGGGAATLRATKAAERAALLAPDATEVRIALALAARARGDVETWRKEAQRAIDDDPRAAEGYALLGDSYSSIVFTCRRDLNAELADKYYRRALELKPDLNTAVSNRATNLRRLGRYAECIDIVNRALKSLSDETPLLLVRGGCRLMQGDMAGAALDLEPLRGNIKVSPAGSLVLLGLLELKRGQTDAGVRDLEKAADLHHSAQSELFVAEAYAGAEDVPRVLVHLGRAFDLDPSCPAMVSASPVFRSIIANPRVKALLKDYGLQNR